MNADALVFVFASIFLLANRNGASASLGSIDVQNESGETYRIDKNADGTFSLYGVTFDQNNQRALEFFGTFAAKNGGIFLGQFFGNAAVVIVAALAAL